MSRGKKLDIFIGADINDSWAQVQTKRKSSLGDDILEANKHSLFFSKEKRRGKTVTLVGEFFLSQDDAMQLLKLLKKKLACGGSYKNNFMEFQGELKERLRELLLQENFKFKAKH